MDTPNTRSNKRSYPGGEDEFDHIDNIITNTTTTATNPSNVQRLGRGHQRQRQFKLCHDNENNRRFTRLKSLYILGANMNSASWLQDFHIGEKIQEEKIFSVFSATYFAQQNLFFNQWSRADKDGSSSTKVFDHISSKTTFKLDNSPSLNINFNKYASPGAKSSNSMISPRGGIDSSSSTTNIYSSSNLNNLNIINNQNNNSNGYNSTEGNGNNKSTTPMQLSQSLFSTPSSSAATATSTTTTTTTSNQTHQQHLLLNKQFSLENVDDKLHLLNQPNTSNNTLNNNNNNNNNSHQNNSIGNNNNNYNSSPYSIISNGSHNSGNNSGGSSGGNSNSMSSPTSLLKPNESLFANQKVLLKIINTKYPSIDIVSLFQREFAILSILNNIDGAIRVIRAQTELGNIFAFVLEDNGYKPLTTVYSNALGPTTPTSLSQNTIPSSSSSSSSSSSNIATGTTNMVNATLQAHSTTPFINSQPFSLSPHTPNSSPANKQSTPQSSSPLITSNLTKFQEIDLNTFISIAIQLASVLEEIHLRGCIHRDIRPSNIYINSNNTVKLANFQYSVLKISGNQQIDSSLLYLGNYPEIGRYNSTSYYYSSPEETGRTQHAVDNRSDLYSLGVTFYELLTGRLPFQTNDLSELIHAHLAKKAPFVSDVNPNVPTIISKIIDKLLKKSPDERYNSSYGLKRDLEICKFQLSSNCQSDEFVLGVYDILHRPHIPTELYSRKNELSQIFTSINRVCKGNKEIIFVVGNSGVGKTSLINAAKKKSPQGPRFISGKFDQYNRGVPYSAIIEALTELIHMILVLSPVELAFYKDKLHRALGPNIGVIVNVMPLLELIVGQFPPVPPLPPSESQNRFDLVFKDFLRVFSEEGHPLILFLDDLQRADEASCRLIRLLLDSNNNLKYLLIIGAMRENELVEQSRLIWSMLNDESLLIPITKISLKPLDLVDVNSMVAASLHKHPNETTSLSEVVLSKTHGNPFFTIQFLKTLFNENLLWFDVTCDSWKWDLTKIQTRQFTDNVVEFMVGNLKQLSLESQRVLQLASCIGNNFDLDMLSIVAEYSNEETLKLLTPIIAQDLIINTDDRKYKFVHDRVQQAAYSLVIVGKDKKEIHLNIGRMIYQNTKTELSTSQIFDIVNQCNVGLDMVVKQEEKLTLSKLNYMAGKKAKSSAAYSVANSYLECALKTLNLSTCWSEHYQISYDIFIEKSECEFMCGNILESERLLEIVIDQSINSEDRGEAIALKIQQYTLQSKFNDCVDYGIEYLRSQGICISRTPTDEALALEYQKIKDKLGGRSFLDLLATNSDNLPPPNICVCIKVMGIMIAPLFFTNIRLLSSLLLKIADLSIDRGCSPWSSVGLVMFGLIVCIGRFDDFDVGYECGKLAMELKELYNEPSTKGKVTLLFGNFINHWRAHMSTNASLIKLSFLESIESGDMGYACYSSVHLLFMSILVGAPLNDIYTLSKKYILFVEQYNFLPMLRILQSHQQFLIDFIGAENIDDQLKEWDEKTFEDNLDHIEIECPKGFHYVFKMKRCYLLGQYEQAWSATLATERYIMGIYAHSPMAIYYTFKSLTILALYDGQNNNNSGSSNGNTGIVGTKSPGADANDIKAERFAMVAYCLERLEIFARNSSENYQVMVLLVQAELARVLGNTLDAMELFSAAITVAQSNKYVQYEALANELAAKMYLKMKKCAVARAYLLEAQLCYSMWGANTKANQLEMEYPSIFNPISSRTPNSMAVGQSNKFNVGGDGNAQSTQSNTQSNQSGSGNNVGNGIQSSGQNTQNGSTNQNNSSNEPRLSIRGGRRGSQDGGGSNRPHHQMYPQVDAFDLCSVITVSHSLAEEIYYDRLLKRLMKVVIRNAGASRGYLLLLEDLGNKELFPNSNNHIFGEMNVAASACVLGEKVNVEVYINRGAFADSNTLSPVESSPAFSSPILKSLGIQQQSSSSSSSSSSSHIPSPLSPPQQQSIVHHILQQQQQPQQPLQPFNNNEELNKAVRDDGTWNLCVSMINYVRRTQSPLLISNASEDKTFSDDLYVRASKPKSVLVLPIVHQGKLVSILYLENNFTTGAFTSGRLEVLNLLSTQIAVSFQNARLFLQSNHLANQAFLAKEEAERANKAKSDFISNMSHEMRTPLNHIIGALELLKEFPLSNDQKELLTISQQSSESLLFMVNNILDLSKVEQGKTVLNFSIFNLASFLEDSIGAIANNAHQKGLMVGLLSNPCTSNIPVIGDMNLLRQILVNLLSNAIKFTAKGEVYIKYNVVPNGSSYTASIEVTDSGIGIKQRDFDKLFQRFSQIDTGMSRAYDGSGLGLSICKQLVELMNGKIGIKSKIGEGSIFHFTLDLARGKEDIRASNELSLYNNDTNIVIFEDNTMIQTQLEQFCRSYGINSIQMLSGGINNDISQYLLNNEGILSKPNNIVIVGLPLNYNEDSVATLIDSIQYIKSKTNNSDVSTGMRKRIDFIVITQLALNSSRSILQEAGILLVNRPIKRESLLNNLNLIINNQNQINQLNNQLNNINNTIGNIPTTSKILPPSTPTTTTTIQLSSSSPTLNNIFGNSTPSSPSPSFDHQFKTNNNNSPSPILLPTNIYHNHHHLITTKSSPRKSAEHAGVVNIVNIGNSNGNSILENNINDNLPKKVLVIEDNELNANILFRMLQKMGINTPDLALNGAEGVEKASAVNYDLILMDIQMPIMDGYEATSRIRKYEGSTKHTPIVAMTANAMGGQREACLTAGCDDYFCKPLKQKDLETMIKKFLNI